MIRFIDLSGQIFLDEDTPHFAFFDTVFDRFCTIGEEQEWDTLSSFSEAVRYEHPNPEEWAERYVRLIPEGYFNDRG